MSHRPGSAQTALLLAAVGVGWPSSARAGALRVDAGLGQATGFYGAPAYWLADVAVTSTAVTGLELALGARVAWGGSLASAAPAMFGRSLLAVAFGSYRPALGLELEATLATRWRPSQSAPPGSLERDLAERNRDNNVRAAVVLCPLRWLWKDWHLGLASLGLATPLSDELGDRLYLTFWGLTVAHPL
jgi:hypothetical protein